MRWLIIGILLLFSACNQVSGADDFKYDTDTDSNESTEDAGYDAGK